VVDRVATAQEPEREGRRRDALPHRQTDEKYYDMGAPAKSILKSRFGGDTYSRETVLDFAAFEAQAKIDEERARASTRRRSRRWGTIRTTRPATHGEEFAVPPKDPNAKPDEKPVEDA
jgi:hypothetical protein